MHNDKIQPEISENLIFSVSEVTLHIRQVIETQIEALYIIGEISNFVRHSSGHLYFNLKDDNSVLRCTFFRNLNYALDFQPLDGDQVVCFGRISVYEKSGQYQLTVQNMFPYGKGALQQKFELLKLKLKAENLFDQEHKKELPDFPVTVGIITSPTGAALQDVLNVMQRRYPCNVIVYPSLMQGSDAADQVIKGLDYFNSNENVDIVLITRGGGSQEDLFCFNDETLARAIFSSNIPVVSAIGHEIDFTIADFVADLRAPTPSAAAELITPDKAEIAQNLLSVHNVMKSSFNSIITKKNNGLQKQHLRIMQYNPAKVWHMNEQRLDEAIDGLTLFSVNLNMLKNNLNYVQQKFKASSIHLWSQVTMANKHRIAVARLNFFHYAKENTQSIIHKCKLAEAKLIELSPVSVLERGYSIVRKNGKIIKEISQTIVGDKISILMTDGTVNAEVVKTAEGQL